MNDLFSSLAKLGLNYERHLYGLNEQERAALRAGTKAGIITFCALDTRWIPRSLEWWDARGEDIFSNTSDGGFVRVDLTPAGRALYSRN